MPDLLSHTTRGILNSYTPAHMDAYLANNTDLDKPPSAVPRKSHYIDPTYHNCPCDESIRSSATIVRVRCSPTCLFARVLRYHLLTASSIKDLLSLSDETVLVNLFCDLRTKKLEWLPQQERVRAYARLIPFLVEATPRRPLSPLKPRAALATCPASPPNPCSEQPRQPCGRWIRLAPCPSLLNRSAVRARNRQSGSPPSYLNFIPSGIRVRPRPRRSPTCLSTTATTLGRRRHPATRLSLPSWTR